MEQNEILMLDREALKEANVKAQKQKQQKNPSEF